MNKIQLVSSYSLKNNIINNNSTFQRVLRPLKNINYAEEDVNFDDIKDPDYNPADEEDEDEDEDDEDDDYEPEYSYNFNKNNVYTEDILVGGIMNEDSDEDDDNDSDYTPSVQDEDSDDEMEYNYKYNNKNMVNVCKRRFENGKVMYRWIKMTKDEAEMENDPDYVLEEN
jgi:hypothetical protein